MWGKQQQQQRDRHGRRDVQCPRKESLGEDKWRYYHGQWVVNTGIWLDAAHVVLLSIRHRCCYRRFISFSHGGSRERRRCDSFSSERQEKDLDRLAPHLHQGRVQQRYWSKRFDATLYGRGEYALRRKQRCCWRWPKKFAATRQSGP